MSKTQDQPFAPTPATGPRELALRRYLRLYWSFLRYCLIREMGFRVNFLARSVTQVVWLCLLVFLFEIIFLQTKSIAGWSRDQYLFFMGTGFVLNSLIDTLFLTNCTNLSELIRTGNLDFALLKPIDEQFLLSCQRIDWAAFPKGLAGVGLLVYASLQMGAPITPSRVLIFTLMMLASLTIMYSLMLTMAASSVWIVRNRGLYEMWFYVTQFARYPAEIYQQGGLAGQCLWITLMFLLPVLLALNVPAHYGAKLVSWELVAYLFAVAGLTLLASRWFFRFALKSYRSASS